MRSNDFLLIQGPRKLYHSQKERNIADLLFVFVAGTGKTHTIKGIISMLSLTMKSDKKILVCAPSNAAIDEIVTRLISKGGLFGQT